MHWRRDRMREREQSILNCCCSPFSFFLSSFLILFICDPIALSRSDDHMHCNSLPIRGLNLAAGMRERRFLFNFVTAFTGWQTGNSVHETPSNSIHLLPIDICLSVSLAPVLPHIRHLMLTFSLYPISPHFQAEKHLLQPKVSLHCSRQTEDWMMGGKWKKRKEH